MRTPIPRHVAAVLSSAAALLWTSTAFAQTVERSVLGWTSTGQEVVVRLVQRGERMVDGVSQDYYFEATEIWSATRHRLIQRYKHGEAVGSPPTIWDEAKSAERATKYLDNVGMVEAEEAAASPSKDYRIVPVSIRKVEPGGKGFECRVRHRLSLFDGAQSRVWTIRDKRLAAPASSRRDESNCPSFSVQTYWHPDAKHWAVLLTDEGAEPQLAVGSVEELDAFPYASFQPERPLVADLSAELADGWQALSDGALDDARKAFSAVKTPEGKLATALVDAFDGKGRAARRSGDSAFRKSPKDAWHRGLRAAVWVMTGRAKKATAQIDQAIKAATGYDDLLKLAALFSLVDVNVANQLAVHALSHSSAAEADTTRGWLLLANGLLDIGEFSKAATALDKIEEDTLSTRLARASLSLDRNKAAVAHGLVDELLFENPGLCAAYFLGGRTASASGENATARNLFEAARTCDPTLAQAVFLSADFARLAGDLERAQQGFEHYLAVAPERRSDPIRTAQRRVAQRWTKRLGHEGAVVTDASCRRVGAAFLCSGTIANTTDQPLEDVVADVYDGRKKVGEAQVPAIAAKTTQPFGVRVQVDSLDEVVVRAGRNEKERRANATHMR
jgi:tetratricopeptide (TPR) repeat protein